MLLHYWKFKAKITRSLVSLKQPHLVEVEVSRAACSNNEYPHKYIYNIKIETDLAPHIFTTTSQVKRQELTHAVFPFDCFGDERSGVKSRKCRQSFCL